MPQLRDCPKTMGKYLPALLMTKTIHQSGEQECKIALQGQILASTLKGSHFFERLS